LSQFDIANVELKQEEEEESEEEEEL